MSTPRISKINSSIQVGPTRPRETPRPALSFQGILRGGANVLLAGAQAASTAVGGPLLTAASEDLKLIALQSEIQRHDRQITLLSNMLKARHDTAKAAIGNIRS